MQKKQKMQKKQYVCLWCVTELSDSPGHCEVCGARLADAEELRLADAEELP